MVDAEVAVILGLLNKWFWWLLILSVVMMLMMVVVGVVAQLVLQLMCSDCSISVYGSKTVALAVIESLWLLVSEHGDGVTGEMQ